MVDPQSSNQIIATALNPLFLPFYNQLCGNLDPHWCAYFGYRSFAQQDELYSHGRDKPGPIVTNAPGGSSAHNFGCAADFTWCEGGKYVWLKDDDSRWRDFMVCVLDCSLRDGSNYRDFGHVELKISVLWSDVGKVYNQTGNMNIVNDYIKAHLVDGPQP